MGEIAWGRPREVVKKSANVHSGVSLSEVRQRRVLVLLAALATISQLGTLLFLHQQGNPRAAQALLSVVITVLLTALTLWPRLSLRTLQRVMVALVCTMFILNLISVFSTGRPVTSGLLIHLVILALLSFAWLPPRVATFLLGGSFLLLAGAATASRGPDLPGVMLAGFTLPLVWYLTLHGREVNRERVRSELLRTMAYQDPLTGVHNRRSGAEALHALIGRLGAPDAPAVPDAGELTVALIDLDHFKRINDTLGHQQGDRVLIAVADTLVATLHPAEAIVRWGGEEFLVILSGLTRAQAHMRVNAALEAVRALRLSGLPTITISAGLAYASETRDPDALLDLADGRLYQAKAAGRDRAH